MSRRRAALERQMSGFVPVSLSVCLCAVLWLIRQTGAATRGVCMARWLGGGGGLYDSAARGPGRRDYSGVCRAARGAGATARQPPVWRRGGIVGARAAAPLVMAVEGHISPVY